MTVNEIETLLIGIVRDIQKISGRKNVPISPATRPLKDLEEFDSLNAVEATIEALTKLNIEAELSNVFADENEALSIEQAAKRLAALIAKSVGK